jgi:hypothetical protein
VLEDGLDGWNRADFANEFEFYWNRLPNLSIAGSVMAPGCEVRWALAARQDKNFYLAGDEADLSAFFQASVAGKYTLQNVLFVPLAQGTVIEPPLVTAPFWTVAKARDLIVSNLSPANGAKLKKYVRRSTGATAIVVVGLPRPAGGMTLFGLHFHGVGRAHPLAEGGTAAAVRPIRLDRWDRPYLVPRGGADSSLGARRVLVAGAGAVGGHICFELVRAGVLDLTVVDPDSLRSENTFRHVLGRNCWGKLKVAALKTAIERQLPYASVTPVPARIEDAVAEGAVELSRYDLVVFALGNPTVELEMNERLHAPGMPPAVFAWVEPYGIGGHVLASGNGSDPGCFECLYTPPGEEPTLENLAAFAALGQSFGTALSGCGTLHTPYGSLDAVQTAVAATRLCVDVLTGRETGNPLRSWRGDPSAFLAAGFQLAPRFDSSDAELRRHGREYAGDGCRVCRQRGAG